MVIEFDKDILCAFVSEAREHLETIEDDFLNLEKQKDNPDPDLVNKVFRAIHTIKGSAGFLGMTNIKGLAHVMETLLSMIRNNELQPESKFVDPLLKGVDMINSMLDNIEHSNEMDISEIHGKLSELLSTNTPSRIKKELDTSHYLSDLKGADIGFDVTEFTLKNIPDNEILYILKYDLIEFTRKGGKSPVALIKQLLSAGDIVDARINTPFDHLNDGIPEGPLQYDVLLSTTITPDNIYNIVELNKDHVIQVRKDNLKENRSDEGIKDQEDTSNGTQLPTFNSQQSDSSNPPAIQSPNTPSLQKFSTGGDRTNTIRINVDILDQLMMLAGELVLVRNQQLINVKSDPVSRSIVQRLDIVTSELQETIMRTRMQPVGNVFNKFTRVVRDLGNQLGKNIEIAISGTEVELDKTILESLADPLTHLVRNCCDHGIEPSSERKANGKSEVGHISLNAYHEGGQINIEIEDDGKGINIQAVKEKVLEKQLKSESELAQMNEKELMSLILLPGFSTADMVSDISGRGVGMDVVKSNIEKLGGTIDIESTMGKRTVMHLRLPLTLAIIPCLIVMVGKYRYAIPQINLVELMCLYDDDVRTKIECAGNNEVYRLRDTLLPMVRLAEVLNRQKPFTDDVRAEITEKYRREQEEKRNNGKGNRLENIINGEKSNTKKMQSTDHNKQVSQSLNFTVLNVGTRRFGLIVDSVLGTEEIVVKPMHPALKSLGCYSGATVMGDGKVALILDVEGIAKHAGIELNGYAKEAAINEDKIDEKEMHTVLLFKNGEKEQFAVPLPLIRRIEHIDIRKIEQIGDKKFITIDGVSTLVLKLDHFLKVSPSIENDEMYLLLPKHTKQPFGILISSLIDIAETSIELNEGSYKEEGLIGSSIVKDSLTLFIDIYRLIEKAEPSWFENKQKAVFNETKKHILLLEDAPFFRQLIKGYLVAEGYNVITAEDGQAGLARFSETDFDLIISDIEMPVMDGLSFLNNIRNGNRKNDIPAIAVTALDSDQDRQDAKECGFNQYETKFNRESFLSTVKHTLGIN